MSGEAAVGRSPRIGVDLGGTKTAVALVVDEAGRASVARRAERHTPASEGASAVVACVADIVAEVDPGHEADVVGIGAAGVVDPATGCVVGSTDAIAGWAGTPLADLVGAATGRRVRVVNDVLAFALGEWAHGVARGAHDVLAVTVGTGVGGAVLTGGVPLVGRHCAAGHVGHLPSAAARGIRCGCGRLGHLEAVASGTAMTSAYAVRSGAADDAGSGAGLRLQDVAAHASSGDAVALDVLRRGGEALGVAIGGLVNALSPDVVVLGGGVLTGVPLVVTALREALADTVIPVLDGVPVRLTGLGPDAAVLGAADLERGEP